MIVRTVVSLCLSLLLPSALIAQEDCYNGIDDDADGLIDLNDTLDCSCTGGYQLLDSVLLNGGFEEHDFCPDWWSQLYHASPWHQATEGTSDFFDTCGVFPDWIPLPLPDGGHGCAGGYAALDYREYLAADLPDLLEAGTSYVLKLSIAACYAHQSLFDTLPINFSGTDLTVFGSSSIQTQEDGYLCPLEYPGFYELGSVAYTPASAWTEISIPFVTTVATRMLVIGAPCDLDTSYGMLYTPDEYLPYFLYDAVGLFRVVPPEPPPIDQAGALCSEDLVLSVPDISDQNAQWFFNGVALPGAVDSSLQVSGLGLGVGVYQVQLFTEVMCSQNALPIEPPQFPVAIILEDQGYLACPIAGTWQWYLNGSPITGATDSTWAPTENGDYTVLLTDAQGCSDLSDVWPVIDLGTDVHGASAWVLTHHPGSGFLEISGMDHAFTFLLIDAEGKRVRSSPASGRQWRCDVSDLPAGLYLAIVDGYAMKMVL